MWAPVPIRLAAGGALVYHGYPKLFTRFGHDNIAHMLRESGVPAPELAAWPIGLFEFLGGLALIVGFSVRPVAAGLLGMTGLNLATMVRREGLPAPLAGGQPLPGVEESAFLGGCSLSVLLTGGGAASLSET